MKPIKNITKQQALKSMAINYDQNDLSRDATDLVLTKPKSKIITKAITDADGHLRLIDIQQDLQKSGVRAHGKVPKYGMGKRKQQITITRNGKTFQQNRTVGTKDKPEPVRAAQHAEKTPDQKLKHYIKNPNNDQHLRQQAKNELVSRDAKQVRLQNLHKHVGNHLKKWHAKQLAFYTDGGTVPDSPQRKNFAQLIKAKAKGIVKGLRHEAHEMTLVGAGLRKLFSGRHKEIHPHEQQALKTFAVHTGMVLGSMAATGGFEHHAALSSLLGEITTHFFEHIGMIKAAHAMFFAKAEVDEDYDNMTDEQAVNTLMQRLAAHVQHGHITEEEWIKMGKRAAGKQQSEKAKKLVGKPSLKKKDEK